jgi:hypothetical protein
MNVIGFDRSLGEMPQFLIGPVDSYEPRSHVVTNLTWTNDRNIERNYWGW